jgi:hypothetical protein
VVWQNFTDVSEELTASSFDPPGDEGNVFLRNSGRLLLDWIASFLDTAVRTSNPNMSVTVYGGIAQTCRMHRSDEKCIQNFS